MRDKQLLVIARDAGPAAALAGLAHCGLNAGARVLIAAYGPGRASFEREGLPVEALDQPGSVAEARRVLEALDVAAVVTGTSLEPRSDGVFWHAAADLGLPAIAVLDHWRAYEPRFAYEHAFDMLPTSLTVMDGAAASGLREVGFPGEITVTGQPYFDRTRRSIDLPARDQARHELGIQATQRVVLFVSEPERPAPGAPTEEVGTLEVLPATLQQVVRRLAQEAPDVLLIVKLHPRERPVYGTVTPDVRPTPEVRWVHSYLPWRLVSAADAVIGFGSIMLLQAWAAGVPAFSLASGDGPERHFLDVHRERIQVGEFDDLMDRLIDGLGRPLGPAPTEIPFGDGAIERVLTLSGVA